ncbi:MAG: N-acetyltransferase [Pseudomonadota bacterium]
MLDVQVAEAEDEEQPYLSEYSPLDGEVYTADEISDIEIRRATGRDFLAIAAIDRVAWGTDEADRYIPDGEHAWRFWVGTAYVYSAWVRLKDHDNELLVGAVLAFLSVSDIDLDGVKELLTEDEVDTRPVFAVHKAFVHPKFRGLGLGTKLFDEVLKKIDASNGHAFLTVKPDNKPARKLYEKMGFTEPYLIKGSYREQEDRLLQFRRAPSDEV